MNEIIKGYKIVTGRMNRHHIAAYAATCAYFLVISFVPFMLIFFVISRQTQVNSTYLLNGIIEVVPIGLKDFTSTIIEEVYHKPFKVVPISIIILVWSASKFFHALTKGLNVISGAVESRSFLYLRIRSMLYIIILLVFIFAALQISVFGRTINEYIAAKMPDVKDFLDFIYPFRSILAYFGLLCILLFVYKFLPDCHYTFKSQLPGALITSTLWMFFSYIVSLYFMRSGSLMTTYGSMTGIVLAMLWLYFCMLFVLVGAELNRMIYEDPEENILFVTIDGAVQRGNEKNQRIREQIIREKAEAEGNIKGQNDRNYIIRQPDDIDIRWDDENENKENMK